MYMYKLVGFGSNGVFNMMGCKNGLIFFIQKEYFEVILIYCLVYICRMELVFKDVFRKDKNYVQLFIFLFGLFYFYKNSLIKRNILQNVLR